MIAGAVAMVASSVLDPLWSGTTQLSADSIDLPWPRWIADRQASISRACSTSPPRADR